MVLQYVVSYTYNVCSQVTRPPSHNKRGPRPNGAILKTQITFYMWFLTHTIFNVCRYFVCVLCHHAILKTDVIKYYFTSIGSLVSIWALFSSTRTWSPPLFGLLRGIAVGTRTNSIHLPLQWEGFSRCKWRVKRPWTSCEVASSRGLIWKGRLRRRDLVCFQL
jgi:hypothetical protein